MRFFVLSSCFLTSVNSDELESSSLVGRPESSLELSFIPSLASNLDKRKHLREIRFDVVVIHFRGRKCSVTKAKHAYKEYSCWLLSMFMNAML